MSWIEEGKTVEVTATLQEKVWSGMVEMERHGEKNWEGYRLCKLDDILEMDHWYMNGYCLCFLAWTILRCASISYWVWDPESKWLTVLWKSSVMLFISGILSSESVYLCSNLQGNDPLFESMHMMLLLYKSQCIFRYLCNFFFSWRVMSSLEPILEDKCSGNNVILSLAQFRTIYTVHTQNPELSVA